MNNDLLETVCREAWQLLTKTFTTEELDDMTYDDFKTEVQLEFEIAQGI